MRTTDVRRDGRLEDGGTHDVVCTPEYVGLQVIGIDHVGHPSVILPGMQNADEIERSSTSAANQDLWRKCERYTFLLVERCSQVVSHELQ